VFEHLRHAPHQILQCSLPSLLFIAYRVIRVVFRVVCEVVDKDYSGGGGVGDSGGLGAALRHLRHAFVVNLVRALPRRLFMMSRLGWFELFEVVACNVSEGGTAICEALLKPVLKA